MKHPFLTLIALIGILLTSNQLCFAQINTPSNAQNKQAEKVKKQVEKIGLGGTITVVRLDGQKLFGRVSVLESDGFQVIETDTRQILSFKYADVKTTYKGDGARNLMTGQRVNPRHSFLIFAAIFGTLIVVLGVALSKDK